MMRLRDVLEGRILHSSAGAYRKGKVTWTNERVEARERCCGEVEENEGRVCGHEEAEFENLKLEAGHEEGREPGELELADGLWVGET